MNTPTPPDAEPTLDRDERELAALYRHLPAVEPDAALDARILGQAEKALERRRPRAYRLLAGFGGFATLVMAAGLTWHIYGQGPGRAPGATGPAVARKATDASVAPAGSRVVHVRLLPQPAEHANEAAEKWGAPTSAAADRAGNLGGFAAPPPPPLASKPASAQAVDSAAFLIAQARQALADEDEARARSLVHQLLTRHPDTKLPSDLARLKPPGESTGKP